MKKIDKLQSELKAGRISRREFVQAASVLGLAAVAPSVFNTAQAMPKKGGKLTAGLGHGDTNDSYDPRTWANDFDYVSGHTWGNHLTEIDNNGNLIGELAESWEASPDAKNWTFALRSGVEFHNGKSFTAQDAVDSINHHRGEDSTSAIKDQLAQITELKADGNRVMFALSGGNADLPFLLATPHLVIMPSKDGKSDWSEGVGTGPYMVEEFEPGVRLKLTRNPNYWKEGRGHFDEVELLTIADVSSRTNALTTGEIDLMDRCEIKTLHLLERNKDITVEKLDGPGHYSVPMRTNLAPFNDNNVRMALKYGLDREAILQTILRGYGSLGNDHPISGAYRYFDPELEQRAYDPDRSKYYLKQAGLSELTVTLAAADAAFGGAVDAAVLYKEHAAKSGITINVERVPSDGYWNNVWNTDNYGWSMCYWSGRSTEDEIFSVAYAADSDWNDSEWQNADFNRLLVAARAELDDAKRRDMYAEMQRLTRDDSGVVVPVFNNFIHARSNDIAHDENMGANHATDGARFAERWWRA